MRRLESELLAEQGGASRKPGIPSPPPSGGEAMASWCGADEAEKKPRRRSWGSSAKRTIEEARERMDSRRWDDAEPRHLVGLYFLLHERVYGVCPEELVGDPWPAAVSAATKLAREVGGVPQTVEFLRWTWARERAREKRREPGSGSRIGWRLQFAARVLLTDWKVDVVRGEKTQRPKDGAGGKER